MPTHFVKSISVASNTSSGSMIWYCVMRASDGSELCRCVTQSMADAICAIFITAEAP